MSVYVTPTRVVELTPGLTIDDAPAFAMLVDRAERDIDDLLGAYPRIVATGVKYDITRLEDYQVDALERAVAAQTVYLLENAPRIDAGARQAMSVKGPDFEETYGTGGALTARYSPTALAELERLSPYLQRTARARA